MDLGGLEEKFSPIKMVTGFFKGTTVAKSIVIGLWIFIILVTVYTFYRAYRKAPPTTTQNAEHIVNYNYSAKPTFGCIRMQALPEKK